MLKGNTFNKRYKLFKLYIYVFFFNNYFSQFAKRVDKIVNMCSHITYKGQYLIVNLSNF